MNNSFLPISIQIASNLVGIDLVSVQPISAPIGSLYYMDFKYPNRRKLKIFKILEKIESLEENEQSN